MRPPGPERPTAPASQASTDPAWRWGLLLVASIHLLTTAGAWYVTDHAEYLFVARRLLDRGTLDLAEPGVRRVAALPWLIAPRDGPLRTRLLPATPLSLLPLLALDRALGSERPNQYGRLVHLQGHVFVLAGLALLASAVQSRGASSRATALTVALTGLVWPVWLVARRIGPEPILVFLVCAFLAGGERGMAGQRRAAVVSQLAVCALLPWVSPTGPLIGLALVLAGLVDAWLDARRGARPAGTPRRPLPLAAWAPAIGLGIGVVSVVLLWNYLYHGDWWLGGYAPYAKAQFFGVRHPVQGFGLHLQALLLEGPFILLLALLGLWCTGTPRAQGLTLPLCLTTALVLLFSSFYQPEPARRLAVVWPCWAVVVGRTLDRLKLAGPVPQALLGLSGLSGFYWLMRYEGRHHLGRDGLFYPNVLWVERLVTGAPPGPWVAALVMLLVLFLVSAAATWRGLRRPA